VLLLAFSEYSSSFSSFSSSSSPSLISSIFHVILQPIFKYSYMFVLVSRSRFQFEDNSSLWIKQHVDPDDNRQYYKLTMVSTIHDNTEGFYTHTMGNGDVFNVLHRLDSRYIEKKKSLTTNCYMLSFFLSFFLFFLQNLFLIHMHAK
jgi:hypothetical protein